jgi:hypothetical protein
VRLGGSEDAGEKLRRLTAEGPRRRLADRLPDVIWRRRDLYRVLVDEWKVDARQEP